MPCYETIPSRATNRFFCLFPTTMLTKLGISSDFLTTVLAKHNIFLLNILSSITILESITERITTSTLLKKGAFKGAQGVGYYLTTTFLLLMM